MEIVEGCVCFLVFLYLLSFTNLLTCVYLSVCSFSSFAHNFCLLYFIEVLLVCYLHLDLC